MFFFAIRDVRFNPGDENPRAGAAEPDLHLSKATWQAVNISLIVPALRSTPPPKEAWDSRARDLTEGLLFVLDDVDTVLKVKRKN